MFVSNGTAGLAKMLMHRLDFDSLLPFLLLLPTFR